MSRTPTEIMTEASDRYDYSHAFSLFSGGDDSLATTHWVMTRGYADAVVFIDTGIGVPETREYVEWVCGVYGWPLRVYHAHDHVDRNGDPMPQIYEELVLEHGFPGPAHHTKMFNRLKGRQIDRLVKGHKTHWKDRVLLITGLRTSESRRRMLLKGREIDRKGAKVWVNPVFYWSDEDVHAYRETHELPRNPVAEKICKSGECLCGAFAKPEELIELEEAYPAVAERIRRLEKQVRAAGFPWGWNEAPPRGWSKNAADNIGIDEAVLCGDCHIQGRNDE